MCICSDPKITQKRCKQEDTSLTGVVDLAMPVSTDPQEILRLFDRIRQRRKPGMTVVCSTYPSIGTMAKAQQVLMQPENGFGPFDLVI